MDKKNNILCCTYLSVEDVVDCEAFNKLNKGVIRC